MTARYIIIDSAHFLSFLTEKGFSIDPNPSGEEIVMIRRHNKEQRLIIKIYTSIRDGSSLAREVNADAIRTIALFETPTKVYPIFKGKNVYRVGRTQAEVEERVLERARAAYVRCNKWLKHRGYDQK
jgi:hypothetical protein